ncbi:putative HTH-type transcriptional regulator [Gordonia insulae]|uniref:Putative HTH-type transcriptional regulator n=2 Tax=Gordonia insulae TaxID=2420509 RepID=A0A3G8JI59_9ACTN|nr:putative HTH-type transcriptional regulator [Gordonia insulae]
MAVTSGSAPAAKRTRMSPEARRDQLVELGLDMVRDRPLEQVSIDAIAEAAGVSRALLFHYFESKQDFHVAIARAQADEMLECTEPDPRLGDPITMLSASMSAFVDYVSDNRKAYMAFMRGSSSADPAMREVFDQTRSVMASRVFDHAPALGISVTPVVEMTVQGWISFVEETTISWLTDPVITRDQLLALITAALPALAAVVPQV